MGGSTKLNRMVFDRGSKADYDDWAELGNKGWDWDTLFPYFKKVRFLDQTQLVSIGHDVLCCHGLMAVSFAVAVDGLC